MAKSFTRYFDNLKKCELTLLSAGYQLDKNHKIPNEYRYFKEGKEAIVANHPKGVKMEISSVE